MFVAQQTWPDDSGNRSTSFFEVGHEGVSSLQLRLVLGHPVVWCRRGAAEAEYPLDTVAKLVRA